MMALPSGDITNRDRTQTGAYIFFVTCVLTFIAFMPQTSAAATYDAARDFSKTSNPNGSWSYGWKASLGGAFTVNTVENSSAFQGIDAWQGPDCGTTSNDFFFPLVAFNNTGSTLNYASGVSQPANMLNLHPSCSGNFSVVRWTAPSTGWFYVVGLFQGIDTRGTTTDVHILHNSAISLLGAGVIGFGDQAPFSFVRHLTAGDTLDFVVGVGFNNNYNADSTGLAVTITSSFYVSLPGIITGVTAGIGLSGGGTSGNVTMSLDTNVTDARYLQLNGNAVSATNAAALGGMSAGLITPGETSETPLRAIRL